MGQPVTVYRWDDPGAPNEFGTDKWPGILAVLKKCLVEGYGDKDPLGWTMPFEDAPGNKVVFRNSTTAGSGGYVQFQKENDNVVWLKPALSMTDIDEFIHDGYMHSINLTNAFSSPKWILIGTSTGFFFGLCIGTVSTYTNSFSFSHVFVGDFISFIKNDPATFTVAAFTLRSKLAASTSPSLNNIYHPAESVQLGSMAYTSTSVGVSGVQTLIPLAADGFPTEAEHNYAQFNHTNVQRFSGPHVGPAQTDRMYLSLIVSGTSNNPNLPNIRGYLPGIICMPVSAHYLDPYPLFANVSGHDHYLVPEFRNNPAVQGGGKRWINCEEWEQVNRD